MRYTYDVYENKPGIEWPVLQGTRIDTSTNLSEAAEIMGAGPRRYIEVVDNLVPHQKLILSSLEDIDRHACDEDVKTYMRRSGRDRRASPPIPGVVSCPPSEIMDRIRNPHAWEPFNEDETDIHMISAEQAKKNLEYIANRPENVDKVAAAVNPTHHKSYMIVEGNADRAKELQWLDAMARMHRYRNPEVFKGAVELQIRKYLDRNGRKDNEAQELRKAMWYLEFLILYIENGGQPVPIDQTARIQMK